MRQLIKYYRVIIISFVVFFQLQDSMFTYAQPHSNPKESELKGKDGEGRIVYTTIIEFMEVKPFKESYHRVSRIRNLEIGRSMSVFDGVKVGLKFNVFDGSKSFFLGPESFRYEANTQVIGIGVSAMISKPVDFVQIFEGKLALGTSIGVQYMTSFRENMGPYDGTLSETYNPFVAPRVDLLYPLVSNYLSGISLSYFYGFKKFGPVNPQYFSLGLQILRKSEKLRIKQAPENRSRSRYVFEKSERRIAYGLAFGRFTLSDSQGGNSDPVIGLTSSIYTSQYIYELFVGNKLEGTIDASSYRVWKFSYVDPFVVIGLGVHVNKFKPGFSYGGGIILFSYIILNVVFQGRYIKSMEEIGKEGVQLSLQLNYQWKRF